jgi:nitronate monooxygenase
MSAFTDQTQVELPITAGAMYPCGNPELVAAASAAGALGVVQPISFAYVHGKSLAEGLARVRDLTDKPIGFNALVEASSKTYEKRMARWIDEAIEAGVRFFVTALGNPRAVCERVHSVGGVVWHDVTEYRFASKAHDEGVDGLIAVNSAAGGHAGVRTLEDLYQELAPLKLPMLAAGGLAQPADLMRALDAGYSGIQMGTRFIASKECKVHPEYKRAIVDAKARDIVRTKRLSGVDVAIIRPDSWPEGDAKPPGEPGRFLSWMLRHPRFKKYARSFLALKSLRDLKRSSLGGLGYKDVFQAGQSVESIQAVESVAEILAPFRAALEARA